MFEFPVLLLLGVWLAYRFYSTKRGGVYHIVSVSDAAFISKSHFLSLAHTNAFSKVYVFVVILKNKT